MAGVKLIGTIQGSKIESIDPARRIGTIQTLPTKRAKWKAVSRMAVVRSRAA